MGPYDRYLNWPGLFAAPAPQPAPDASGNQWQWGNGGNGPGFGLFRRGMMPRRRGFYPGAVTMPNVVEFARRRAMARQFPQSITLEPFIPPPQRLAPPYSRGSSLDYVTNKNEALMPMRPMPRVPGEQRLVKLPMRSY